MQEVGVVICRLQPQDQEIAVFTSEINTMQPKKATTHSGIWEWTSLSISDLPTWLHFATECERSFIVGDGEQQRRA
jgi:hypothetical protein